MTWKSFMRIAAHILKNNEDCYEEACIEEFRLLESENTKVCRPTSNPEPNCCLDESWKTLTSRLKHLETCKTFHFVGGPLRKQGRYTLVANVTLLYILPRVNV